MDKSSSCVEQVRDKGMMMKGHESTCLKLFQAVEVNSGVRLNEEGSRLKGSNNATDCCKLKDTLQDENISMLH